jgi:cytochrome oxidase Cu insertion factor (SCO1/SenC/PrrC family)
MNKGKAATRGRTPDRAREGKRRTPFVIPILVLGLAVVGLAIGLGVYFSQSRQPSPTSSSPAPAGSNSIASVGQPAPAFSLMDQYGQPYTLNPGDGKNHLLVFYMGYF